MDSTAIEDALEADAHRGVSVTVVMIVGLRMGFGVLPASISRSSRCAVSRYFLGSVHPCQGQSTLTAQRSFLGSENLSTASLDYNRELRSNHLIRQMSSDPLSINSVQLTSQAGQGQRARAPLRPLLRPTSGSLSHRPPLDPLVATRSTTRVGATSPGNTAVTTITE